MAEIENSSCSVLVWDLKDSPSSGDWTTVLWRSFASQSIPFVSIPSLVEVNADILKKKYLEWVFYLGETRHNGVSLVDHLELRPGFSYWWMTLIAEKCNLAKSPQIDHAIRLMAFGDWIADQRCRLLTLASSDGDLADSMRAMSEKLGFAFEWRPKTVEATDYSPLKRVYHRLPNIFQSLIWLVRYVFERFQLKGVGSADWLRSNGQTTFVSYLDNLLPSALSEGRFESRYWAHLPAVVEGGGTKTNWLHLYVPDKTIPTAAAAAEVIRKFNGSSKGRQVHVTLDSFLSGRVIFRTICDFGRLSWKTFRLQPAEFFEATDKVIFWPLFRKEWLGSFFWATSMLKVIFFNLF